MKTKSTVIKIICSILISILGILMVIHGIVSVTWYVGDWTAYEYYGGDAYTGIQHATAAAANNVDEIGDYLQTFCNISYCYAGIFLIIIGIYLLACSISTLPEKKKDSSIITKLNVYKELLAAGKITQEEFDDKRKELLGI